MNDHPTELGGFERRLLRALTELDQRRTVAAPTPARRKGPWHRPAVIAGAMAGVVLAGAATATAARLLDDSGLDTAGGRVIAGHPMLVKGWGCAAGSVVIVSLDGVEIGTTTASEEGTFLAQPTVPLGTSLGPHAVSARCDDGVRHDAVIEVVPQPEPEPPVLVAPAPVAAGRPVGAKGVGCRPGATVTVRLDGRPIGTVTADGSAFYVDLAVPPGTSLGAHTLETICRGAAGAELVLSAALTVVEPEEEGPLLAAENHAGGTVAVKGTGCRAGTSVAIRLDGGLLGSTTADANGFYAADLALPATTSPGRHELEATCTGADGRELRLTTTLRI